MYVLHLHAIYIYSYIYDVIQYLNSNETFYFLIHSQFYWSFSIAFLSKIYNLFCDIFLFFFRRKVSMIPMLSSSLLFRRVMATPSPFFTCHGINQIPLALWRDLLDISSLRVTCWSQGVPVYTPRKRIILLFDLWIVFHVTEQRSLITDLRLQNQSNISLVNFH